MSQQLYQKQEQKRKKDKETRQFSILIKSSNSFSHFYEFNLELSLF
jgi:hypothetical protein